MKDDFIGIRVPKKDKKEMEKASKQLMGKVNLSEFILILWDRFNRSKEKNK